MGEVGSLNCFICTGVLLRFHPFKILMSFYIKYFPSSIKCKNITISCPNSSETRTSVTSEDLRLVRFSKIE